MTKQEMNDLYAKYGLNAQDVHKHAHYTIFTRSGIEKIQAKSGIQVTFEGQVFEKDFAVVKATATKGSAKIESYGSALKRSGSVGNSQTDYLAEMAEKRSLSRAILKMEGLYAEGVMGEDEAEDFRGKRSGSKLEDIKDKLD